MPRRLKLGTTNEGRHVFFPPKLRQYGLHVIGAPGQGKSKFMEHLLREDLRTDQGLCLIDPHGSLYDDIVTWCASTGILDRRSDIALFDPSAKEWTFGFNPLDFGTSDATQAADAVAAMQRAIGQVWGGEDFTQTPRLARRLPAILYAARSRGLTLPDAIDLCAKSGMQAYVTSDLDHAAYRREWEQFNQLKPSDYIEMFESVANRLAPFSTNPLLAAMTGQTESIINFEQVMRDGGVVLINLARLSEENKRIFGMLMVNDIFSKGILRDPNASRPFHLYLDEAYYFFNEDIERIIVGLRKFGVWPVIAHHNFGQLEKAGRSVEKAVMMIPNRVVFGGLEPEDARKVALKVFLGELNLTDAKHSRPMVVGHVRSWLQNFSDTTGRSTSASEGRTSGTTTSKSASVTTDPDGNESKTTGSTAGASFGTSSTTGFTDSVSSSAGSSETFESVWEEEPTVFYSLEEQIYRAMDVLVNQPMQHAVIKLYQSQSEAVKTPTVKEPLITQDFVEEEKELVFERTDFAQPTPRAEAAIADRRRKLERDAHRAVREMEPKSYLEG